MKCGIKCLWCQTDLCFKYLPQADVYDWIYEYLLTSMAAVQAEDVRASLLFEGDLNGHCGWVLRPRTVIVVQLSTLQRYPVLISCLLAQIHAPGGTLDLLMTDVPHLMPNEGDFWSATR